MGTDGCLSQQAQAREAEAVSPMLLRVLCLESLLASVPQCSDQMEPYRAGPSAAVALPSRQTSPKTFAELTKRGRVMTDDC